MASHIRSPSDPCHLSMHAVANRHVERHQRGARSWYPMRAKYSLGAPPVIFPCYQFLREELRRQRRSRTVMLSYPTVLIMGPYMAWALTGFLPVDARATDRTMIQSYLIQGAQAAEVQLVVSGHSTMSGFANVTLADGSAVTTQCKGDKATYGGECLLFCE